ncbi:MAG TPA: FAD-dependent oxidoreductase [Polyangiaceae bacterium]|nr:FAD-dependent oxidoreductase [Polyangiaceae bacterium]
MPSQKDLDATRPAVTDHRSPWQPAGLLDGLRARTLDEDITADICVIGAGMAGVLCALELAERGRSVVVVERAHVGAGDTSATTAHLSAVLDRRYFELASMHGKDAARLVAMSHMRAIAHLERVANVYGIECGFRRVSGFLCADDEAQEHDLEREQVAASVAGLTCELVKRAPMTLTHGPALEFPNQAQFEPLAFLAGVLKVLEKKGGQLYAPVTVNQFETGNGSEVTLGTAQGKRIRAGHVVVATNSPINDVAVIHTKQAAYRTYAIGFEFADMPPTLSWDLDDPYHYVRLAVDAETARPILIVGGEDHRVGQGDEADKHFPRLETWARERFPTAGDTVCQWSGQVFEPSDGLAFIGKNPRQERVFIATGFSGNGMTYSALSAELIADLIAGASHPFAKIYDPRRKPASAAAISNYVQENLNTAAQYSDWIAPADVASADDIPRGEGAVVRRGLTRVAIYVDNAGTKHELSATCPHLGGVVAWNSAEKSWDCPCHGSRFDCHGKVVTGPAVDGLKPLNQ